MKRFPFHTVEIYYSPRLTAYIHSTNKEIDPPSWHYAYPVDIDKDCSSSVRNATMYNSSTGKYDGPESILISNELEDLKVLDIRYSSGGFKYLLGKEIEGVKLLFEILDVDFTLFLKEGGSIDNGIMKGKFRFINRSGAKLVHVGGHQDKEYRRVNEDTSLDDVVKVKSKDLVPGTIMKSLSTLRSRNQDTYVEFSIYLGKSSSLQVNNYYKEGVSYSCLEGYHYCLTVFGRLEQIKKNRVSSEHNLLKDMVLSIKSTKSIPSLYVGFVEADVEKELRDLIKTKGLADSIKSDLNSVKGLTCDIVKESRGYYYSSRNEDRYSILTSALVDADSNGVITNQSLKPIFNDRIPVASTPKLISIMKEINGTEKGTKTVIDFSYKDMFPIWGATYTKPSKASSSKKKKV